MRNIQGLCNPLVWSSQENHKCNSKFKTSIQQAHFKLGNCVLSANDGLHIQMAFGRRMGSHPKQREQISQEFGPWSTCQEVLPLLHVSPRVHYLIKHLVRTHSRKLWASEYQLIKCQPGKLVTRGFKDIPGLKIESICISLALKHTGSC